MTAWRPATAAEIREYYQSVFPELAEELHERYTPPAPKEYGLAFRESHPCVGDDEPPKDFIRRSTWATDDDETRLWPLIEGWQEWLAFIQTPASADPIAGSEKALADPALLPDRSNPVPEAVYYRLDNWERPWIVMVDIDAKEVAARSDAAADEILEAAPDGYEYRFEDLDRTLELGFETEALFQTELNAEETMVVYSGQGVHVYMLDRDRYHTYDARSREVLTRLLDEQFEIPLDPPVTSDPKRFGRLPYSLHGSVSRVVQPIESPEFDYRHEGLPPFLRASPDGTPTTTSTITANV